MSANPRYDLITAKCPLYRLFSRTSNLASSSTGNAPIVGIGVSAGGLKASSELLTRLPENTGLSFVFIQHLDPFHESRLEEVLQQRNAIFGTDLSDAALERALAGMYPESISVDVSADRLRKFSTRVNCHYKISRGIRECASSPGRNLTKDPPFSHLDLLICRNLLVYLGAPLQKKLMGVFHCALNTPVFWFWDRRRAWAVPRNCLRHLIDLSEWIPASRSIPT